MNCDLFHTTALINNDFELCALIDPGSSAFAIISQKHIINKQIKTYPLSPRIITGVINDISGVIDRVANISLDIGGLTVEEAWAYVVPNLGEELILGMPWLKYFHAELDSARSQLNFNLHNTSIISNEARESAKSSEGKSQSSINQIMASTFTGLVQKAKKNGDIEVFAASTADIDKALRPKPHLSMEKIREILPGPYKSFAQVFNPKEAATLPPHRQGIDHEIPLEKDEKGNEKQVPWGPL